MLPLNTMITRIATIHMSRNLFAEELGLEPSLQALETRDHPVAPLYRLRYHDLIG